MNHIKKFVRKLVGCKESKTTIDPFVMTITADTSQAIAELKELETIADRLLHKFEKINELSEVQK